MTVFQDLPVVPVTEVKMHVAYGGPIWPDFDQQRGLRHLRRKEAWDKEPPYPHDAIRMDGEAVWGGFLDSHFGHFVGDHVSRVVVALHERPDDPYLFTVDPGMTRDRLPGWVWQVFEWIGLPREQVHLVTEPLIVGCLRAGFQAETLPQTRPWPRYLTMIDPWVLRLSPRFSPLLYVSREGYCRKGGGGHAGEGYLADLLRQMGVAVIDPARVLLRDQLEAYAGAEHIVFAEGSAQHGRQLLGRIDQRITVLRRRPKSILAKAMLAPRCREISFVDAGHLSLMAYWRRGVERPDPVLNFYDLDQLFGIFRDFGVDLAANWDAAAYEAEALADVKGWLAYHDPKGARAGEYQAVLSQTGLAHS